MPSVLPPGLSARMERVLWSSYPSWRHFSWLYVMSALVLWRAVLFKRFDLPIWEAWLLGALVLLITAALVRRWARYEMTSRRLIVRNGYTGRMIAERSLTPSDRVELWQGPVARLLGVGTLAVVSNGDPVIRFRGLREPADVKQRIERLILASGATQMADRLSGEGRVA